MRLTSLHLRGFKGIGELDVGFGEGNTDILGRNATGKTTLYDAYTWLLFGRDSLNSATFEVKTISVDGSVEPERQHSVHADFLLDDGSSLSLGRSLTERWTRKRGSAKKDLVGHETIYQVDGERVNKSIYDKRVGELVNEAHFRLLSDPLYFSEGLKWQERRDILMDLVEIDDEALLTDEAREALGGRSPASAKKALEDERRALRRELDAAPVRIAEARRGIAPGPSVEEARATLAQALQVGGDEALEAYQGAVAAQQRLTSDYSKAVSPLLLEIERCNANTGLALTRKTEADAKVKQLRKDYKALSTECRCCGQPLPEEGIAKQRNDLIEAGKKAAEQAKAAQAELDEARERLGAARAAFDQAKAEQEHALADAETRVADAKAAWAAAKPDPKTEADARAVLAAAEAREAAQARVDALLARESETARSYEEVEAKLFALEEYGRARVRAVEDAINARFEFVKFRLFTEQLNEGVAETCIATRDGVPYDNLNTAGKVQVGMDIIRALQAHYGVSVPLWVDGAESILTLPEMDCQVIRLVVSSDDPVLRVVEVQA